MDEFRRNCMDLQMRIDAALMETGQTRPRDEVWVRRVSGGRAKGSEPARTQHTLSWGALPAEVYG